VTFNIPFQSRRKRGPFQNISDERQGGEVGRPANYDGRIVPSAPPYLHEFGQRGQRKTDLIAHPCESIFILGMHWSWLAIKKSFADDGHRNYVSESRIRSVFEMMRATGEMSPAPGFYARVLCRIEDIEENSIWIPFIYSRSSVRLATACFTLSLLLFAYVVTAEWNRDISPANGQGAEAVYTASDVQQQRDAVLRQLAIYRKPN